MFYLEICTPEGRWAEGEEKGGSANFKAKHTEPLTQEITLLCLGNNGLARKSKSAKDNIRVDA